MHPTLEVSADTWMEIENFHEGTFAPLAGFMDRHDYRSVISNMRLSSGAPWTIPVTLSVAQPEVLKLKNSDRVTLIYREGVATLEVSDIFEVDLAHDVKKLFGTDETKHPGVRKELAHSRFRMAGRVQLEQGISKMFPQRDLTPDQVKTMIRKNGWQKVTGFQTRNPIHRAHEYLQRVALEITDGLIVQPLVGWKQEGDFTPQAVMHAYDVQFKYFYPPQKTLLVTLRTPMRYAGPREAVFHAILRRNFGCTHFIVGRDHAGVGGYYGKYDAQKLCLSFSDLGITILPLGGPYYCRVCATIVTEHSCRHRDDADQIEISGTLIKKMLKEGKCPPVEMMRKEIADALIAFGKSASLFNKEIEDESIRDDRYARTGHSARR